MLHQFMYLAPTTEHNMYNNVIARTVSGCWSLMSYKLLKCK